MAKAKKKAKPKKAAPKKAPKKKAAPKKAAPKKAAKKAAPKKAPAKAAAKKPAKAPKATETPKAPKAEVVEAAVESADDGSVKSQVLSLFRDTYGAGDWDEAKILGTDPNDFDLDPAPFYEQLQQMFSVADDPASTYFGGFGGKVSETIAFIEKQRATGGAAPSEPEETPIDDEE